MLAGRILIRLAGIRLDVRHDAMVGRYETYLQRSYPIRRSTTSHFPTHQNVIFFKLPDKLCWPSTASQIHTNFPQF